MIMLLTKAWWKRSWRNYIHKNKCRPALPKIHEKKSIDVTEASADLGQIQGCLIYIIELSYMSLKIIVFHLKLSYLPFITWLLSMKLSYYRIAEEYKIAIVNDPILLYMYYNYCTNGNAALIASDR